MFSLLYLLSVTLCVSVHVCVDQRTTYRSSFHRVGPGIESSLSGLVVQLRERLHLSATEWKHLQVLDWARLSFQSGG